MDTSEYLPMFLAECREHLQELNISVVRLEESPDDRATIDEIFRIAHSIKGMSGAMGFVRIAELTHAMEDVLDLVREGRAVLETAAVDVLLACLDALGAAVDAVDATGEEELEAEPLIARLKLLVGEAANGAEGEASDQPVAAPDAGSAPTGAVSGPTHNVTIQLRAGVAMPSVRAYQALTALGDLGHLRASTPTLAAVDDFTGATIAARVQSERPQEELRAALDTIPDLEQVTIELEDETAAAVAAAPEQHGSRKGSTTVRVDAERLDQLMHLMGELVVHRTRVESLISAAGVTGLSQAMQDLTRSSQALQALVMQVRMIPVEAVFMRFPRLIRDLSSKLGKQVELVLTGRDTELDRTVVEALGDPLVHLVRNSLDHGLEPADERAAAGKPTTGCLEIGARHAGGSVVITVRDDGRGIDPARVARIAVDRGLITPDAEDSVDMTRAIELLFAAGFSTAEVMSDVSGRGVGMDAVRTMIRELGGEVVLSSELGVGTTAQIRLPLTLAIVATLLVDTGGNQFAIGLDRVERTLKLDEHPVRSAAGVRMLLLRDGVLPLIDLAAAVGYPPAETDSHAVIVRAGDQRLALAVDRLVGQRELVTRALPPEFASGGAAFSGGAVLSHGEIALIVDCDALADMVGRRDKLAA